jgi:PAS domain S-box-containing protein
MSSDEVRAMTQLGDIPVNHSRAFIEARDKVRAVAELLSLDPMTTARIAAAVSQLCRGLYRENNPLSIQVAVISESGRPFLMLGFEHAMQDACAERLNLFFERISSRPAADGIWMTKTYTKIPGAIPERQALANVTALLQGKSRDQLIAEIQIQNRKLEAHRSNLEQTVSQRTRELELASERMRVNEERTRLLLESVGDGIFGVDGDGKVNFMNPAGSAMLGFEADELLGRKIHPLVHHSRADGSPYPAEECPMYHSYTQGGSAARDDEVLWRKDGGSIPVEYISKPIVKDGELSGSVVIFRDISERKRAEEQIRESERRYRFLAERPGQIVYDSDLRDGTMRWSGDVLGVTGYTVAELAAKNDYRDWEAMIHPEDIAAAKAAFEQALPGGETCHSEYRLLRKDGSYLFMEDDGIFLRDGDGSAYRMLGLIRDISERKRWPI